MAKKPQKSPGGIEADVLKGFHPVDLATDEGAQDILASAQVLELGRNKILFKKAPPPDETYYLLDGEVEIRESFENRKRVEAGTDDARNALEEQCKGGATVRALGEVRILVLSRDAIDSALANSDGGLNEGLASLDVQILTDDDEVLEEARFDDAYSEDWMANILDSPLLACLSASDIQRCFMELERVEVKESDEIVTAGTRGEHFYILMQGEAEVLTEPKGPFAGQTFDLAPGDYFGEEALVADTIRNATVRMASDGAVGRLNREQFDAIFRKSLIQTIASDKAQGFLNGQGMNYQLLDVRFPPEFRHEHREGAQNLPIVLLRKKLRELDRKCTYLVTPEGGRRSDLAVFLLRQSGLNAYLISN